MRLPRRIDAATQARVSTEGRRCLNPPSLQSPTVLAVLPKPAHWPAPPCNPRAHVRRDQPVFQGTRPGLLLIWITPDPSSLLAPAAPFGTPSWIMLPSFTGYLLQGQPPGKHALIAQRSSISMKDFGRQSAVRSSSLA